MNQTLALTTIPILPVNVNAQTESEIRQIYATINLLIAAVTELISSSRKTATPSGLYVPYLGAVKDVNLGTHGLEATYFECPATVDVRLPVAGGIKIGHAAAVTYAGAGAIAIGNSASATDIGGGAFALGDNATATDGGGGALAVGASATANGNAISIGASSSATDSGGGFALSIGLGSTATDTGGGSVAVGLSTAQNGIALGIGAVATTSSGFSFALALGTSVNASNAGGGAIAIGMQATATDGGHGSICISTGALAATDGEISFGLGTTAYATIRTDSTFTLNGGAATGSTTARAGSFYYDASNSTFEFCQVAGTWTPMMLNPMTTNGDIICQASGIPARVGIGSTGQVLMVSGGLPVWSASTSFTNPMAALGDMIYGGDSSGTPYALIIGSATQVLAVSTGGIPEWVNAPSGFANPMTTDGDVIYGGASGAAERLGIGGPGQVLTVSGGSIPEWANPPSGFVNPMNAAGQMIYGATAGAATLVAAGTSGQILTSGGTATPVWISTLPVANGGTDIASYSTGDMLYASGSTTFSKLGIGSSGKILGSSGTAPQWVATTTITALGTITTGVWNGTVIGVVYGGTGLTSCSDGELIYASGSNTFSLLTASTGDQILASNSGGTAPVWIDTVPIDNGGTGASTAAQAIINLGASPVAGSTALVTTGTVTTGTWAAVINTSQACNVGSLAVSGSAVFSSGFSAPPGTSSTVSAFGCSSLNDTGSMTVGAGLSVSGTSTLNAVGAAAITCTSLTVGTSNFVVNSSGVVTAGAWNGSVIGVAYGGTGINASTAGNGKLLIGNGSGYTLATLTAGSGVSITNGSGSITISASVTGMVNPMTTLGDMIYCSASGSPGTPQALSIGASQTVLTSNGNSPSWSGTITLSSIFATSNITSVSTIKCTTGYVQTQVIAGFSGAANGGILQIQPGTDGVTSIQMQNTAGTAILTVDTSNKRIGINKTPGAFDLDVNANANVGGTLTCGHLILPTS